MAQVIDTIYRSYSDLSTGGQIAGLKDPDHFCILSAGKHKALESNPFRSGDDAIVQIVGVQDKTIIGGISVFQNELVIDGEKKTGCFGSWLYISPKFRTSMYPVKVKHLMLGLSVDGLGTASAMAPATAKAHQLLHFPVFEMQQFAYVRKSRYFLKPKCKGITLLLGSIITDALLWGQRKIAEIIAYFKTRTYALREIDVIDDSILSEISKISESDGHRFRESHPPKWFKWVLSNDFRSPDICYKHIYGLYKRDELCGYFMVDMHNDHLSARYARIIDWMVPNVSENDEAYFLLRLASKLVKDIEYVAIVVDNPMSLKVMKGFKFYRQRRYPVAILIDRNKGVGKIAGIYDRKNWKIRPAMADVALF